MSKVFIGMPAYNGVRFIEKAINSLIAQSFEDWQLLISDDCSNDETGQVVQKFTKIDSRIIYYRQEKNIGMFPNFKFVLDKANGEYFMWVAHDDIREKDYLKVCVEKLENNKNLGFATTVLATIDSSGKTLVEEKDLLKLSGRPGFLSVARYVFQPEILGKCNLMYGLFRISVIRDVWTAYPQRHVWGQDYMFSLALISRFGIYVDERILFKKRIGGFSDPKTPTDNLKNKPKNPKNQMFPFGRFIQYFKGHMEALRGTHYRLLVAIILFIRLPRAFFIYLGKRNYKRFIRQFLNK